MGAPQIRLSEMAQGLKKKGWDISVLTSMPNYPTGEIFTAYRGKIFCKEYQDSIEIRRFWLFASNSRKIFPRIISMLSFSLSVFFSLTFLRKGKFDYVIAESPPLTLGLSAYLLSRFAGSRLILNVSDLWPLSAKELGAISDGFLYRKLMNLERYIYKKSFICLGQSQEIVNYIKQNGGSNTYLFRNGVDPKRFMKHGLVRDNKSVKIVYTGLLGIAQGILEICKHISFKSLGVEFHIYGAGAEKEEIERYLTENPERGIIYHGTVSSNEIPDILSQYTATLTSLVKNIYGAVPSKIYESMAAGLPILFSGDGEGRYIIEEYNLGWTSAAKDYITLQSNIKKLQSDREEYRLKKENCIKAAAERFNRTKQIDDLHNYLSSFN